MRRYSCGGPGECRSVLAWALAHPSSDRSQGLIPLGARHSGTEVTPHLLHLEPLPRTLSHPRCTTHAQRTRVSVCWQVRRHTTQLSVCSVSRSSSCVVSARWVRAQGLSFLVMTLFAGGSNEFRGIQMSLMSRDHERSLGTADFGRLVPEGRGVLSTACWLGILTP